MPQLIASPNDLRHLVTRLAWSLTTPAQSVTEAVVDALRLIAQTIDADRAIIWRRRSADPQAVAVASWIRPLWPTPPAPLDACALPLVAGRRIDVADVTCFSSLDDLRSEREREAWRRHGVRSAASIPLAVADDDAGWTAALIFDSTRERRWPVRMLEQLCIVGSICAQTMARADRDAAQQRALGELRELRRRVGDDRVVRRPARLTREPGGLVAESEAARHAVDQVKQVAPTTATVLLLGETGTGKELFARAIHELSPRRHRRMMSLNCAAIPSTLVESELFGREAGAYTGAVTRQAGRFEAADQSTLLLDEIGELPFENQVKLLHVLQDHVVERLGGNQPIAVDVRVIASTNCNLEQAVNDRRFREDLFYRLNVFPIHVPALRDRLEDLPFLVWQLIDEIAHAIGKRVDAVSAESMRQLTRYEWPGNVRELRNVIERAVIRATGSTLTIRVPNAAGTAPAAPAKPDLVTFERDEIRAALTSAGWRIRGGGGAAERLGLKPTTLEGRMAKLGLARPRA